MLIDSSVVAYPVAGGNPLWIAHASGPSAKMATPPAVIRPGGICSHPVTGMTNVALPTPTSVGYAPVRWLTGGAAAFPSRNSRSCPIPDKPSRCGGKVSPRTGSSQISPPKTTSGC